MDFLIQLRTRKEEEAQARLARRLASIRELIEEIEATGELKARLAADLGGKMKAGFITAALLTLYRDYDHKLAKDLAKLNEFLRLSRREESKERAALAKASIDRKIMEKLKEKKQAEFRAGQLCREQNELEEMAALAKAVRDRAAGLDMGGGA